MVYHFYYGIALPPLYSLLNLGYACSFLKREYHHLSDSYIDLTDHFVAFSDSYVDLSDMIMKSRWQCQKTRVDNKILISW